MAEADEGGAAGASLPTWTLMTRLDCPLCTSFELALANWEAGRGRFRLHVTNVDSSPALVERYGMRVPVLLAGEREICAFRFRAERVAAEFDPS
jgi:hypothetical protein